VSDRTFTLVSFHAHPDDEALLTAGTLARAAAEGHRVVLVVATAGEAGLAASTYAGGSGGSGGLGGLAAERSAELDRSAAALGCARVVRLGYADSGMADARTGQPDSFADADLDTAARRLADILVEESADVLTTYDPAGGYGHPDHVAVHRVGARAAELAGTPVVLQATVDRRVLLRVLRLLGRARRPLRLPPEFDPHRFVAAYTDPADLTHRVRVGRYAGAKRAAMQAHSSQASADFGARTLSFCLRLPDPLFRAAFGREWFVQAGRSPVRPLLDDVFGDLRGRA
jgi:LmbE family N-acetylglucosaminyl deacetylase